ncbi:MAG: hypothetical protein ABI388_00140 [Bacteroidia bacterium]
MKKTFVLAASIMVVTLISFACKKSTSTPSPNTTTTSNTGSTTGPTSSYSVNGVDQGSGSAFTLIKGPSTSPSIYKFILVGSSGNWTLDAIFSGTLTPTSGQYSMEDSTNIIPAAQCFFQLAGSNNTGGVATAGTLTVTTGATSTISFNNVLIPQPNGGTGTTTTYTVSGNIRY